MAPHTILIKDPLPLRFLVAQLDYFRAVAPVGFRVIGAEGLVWLYSRRLLAARKQRHTKYANQEHGGQLHFGFHRPAPCTSGVATVAVAVVPGLIPARRVIKYAVSAWISSSVKLRCGSMLSGCKACGLRSQASIHAGVNQFPALFRFGPTYPPPLPIV